MSKSNVHNTNDIGLLFGIGEDGGLTMENGKWKMENGEWRMENEHKYPLALSISWGTWYPEHSKDFIFFNS